MDIPLASTTSKSNSNLTSNIGASTPGTGNNNNRMWEDMFEKVLTPSDIGKLNRLVIPSIYAAKYFPLDAPNGKILSFKDRNGKTWKFRYSYWNSSHSYVMTKGWSRFVKDKKLNPGDTISFRREIGDKSEASRFYIDWKHRSDMRRDSFVQVRDHSRGEAFSGKIGSGSTIGIVERTSNPNLECSSFNSFLNTRGLTLSGCRATDIIDFLSMQKNMADSNVLVWRLSAACERCGIKPKDNPFRSLAIIRYLQLVRRISRKTECIVFSCEDHRYTIVIKRILETLHEKNVTSLSCNLSQENLDVEIFYRCNAGILVLTNSFARSSHSLDHLVTIMERWKAKDLVVIPVYYDVTLSDILKTVQQPFLNNFKRDKLPKWEAAIAELGSIDGHHYYELGNMFEPIKLLSLACPRMYLKTTDNLVRILALLDHPRPSDAAEIEGIWGMAGIGKTSIAREIFDILSPQYDLCYFVQDIHQICHTKGLRQIREDFFSKVFGEERLCIGSSDMKTSFLRDWFHKKSVLVILDDVNNARDAEYVVGGFDWFSGGHKIILTSRRKQVLIQCKVKNPYKMQQLDEFESTRLFKACYLEGNELQLSLASVVNYSCGIPLVVKVICESAPWNYSNFYKLRRYPPAEIQKAFQRSFEGLDENEKNIFLDLACFFQGENKDHVVQLLDAYLGICDLIEESLISLMDNRIEIPVAFQDVGRFIVREKDRDPCKRSRLWDTDDIEVVLTNNSATEAIEGIFLDASDLTWELSPTMFGKMNKLRLLKFYCSTSGNQVKLSLPQGLETLPDQLRLLHWENYPLKHLPQKFNPEYLVELYMPYSNLEKLWEAEKNLEKLRKINLSHSRNLADIQILAKTLNLEHIDLEGCTSLIDVSTSVPRRGKLISLNMKDCSHLKSLPAMCELTSLELLYLSGCTEVEEIQDFAPNLKELYLAGTAIRKLPSSVVNLTELGILDLENCGRLQQLPPGIRNSRSNLKLKLSGCTNLELWKRKSFGTDLFSEQEKGNQATKRIRLKEYYEEKKEEKVQPQKTDQKWKSPVKFLVKEDCYTATERKEDEEKKPSDSTVKFPAKEDWTEIKEEKPDWLELRL